MDDNIDLTKTAESILFAPTAKPRCKCGVEKLGGWLLIEGVETPFCDKCLDQYFSDLRERECLVCGEEIVQACFSVDSGVFCSENCFESWHDERES